MFENRQLGKTGFAISRIGISSSFGAEKRVYEEAFDRGCNYFTWGTFIKGRSSPFRTFMNEVGRSGRRDRVILGLLSYSHSAFLGDMFLHSALKQLHTDYVDSLLLGYFSKRPPQRIIEWSQKAKEKGLIRAVGITTHNRKMVAQLMDEGGVDYFHIRYNAVHRGAEQEIFPYVKENSTGLVSFTATSWGQLLQQKKMPPGVAAPSAGDCYRFVITRNEIDCCMMGVKDIRMLQENFKHLEKGPMTEEELDWITGVGRHIYGR